MFLTILSSLYFFLTYKITHAKKGVMKPESKLHYLRLAGAVVREKPEEKIMDERS